MCNNPRSPNYEIIEKPQQLDKLWSNYPSGHFGTPLYLYLCVHLYISTSKIPKFKFVTPLVNETQMPHPPKSIVPTRGPICVSLLRYNCIDMDT